MTFEIPFPRVEWIRRSVPNVASAGDRARVRLEPGVIEFLESPVGGVPFGSGYQIRYTILHSIGATLAHALVETGVPARGSWAVCDTDIEFLSTPETRDVLIGKGELSAIDGGAACCTYRVHSAADRLLVQAVLRLACIRDGNAVATTLLPRQARKALEVDTRRLLGRIEAPKALNPGRTAAVNVTVVNPSPSPLRVQVSVRLPCGEGLSLDGDATAAVDLAATAAATLSFRVRADRPDEVNLGRPWRLLLLAQAGAMHDSRSVDIAVPDPEPGRVFYVLTEDCETFDGGPLTGDYGAAAVLGNANDAMDPEEYRVQMIQKPARMNEIAERYGARWTHFWCAPQRFAVDWAVTQSTTGAWADVARELDESIRRGAVRHEYAPHIHFDYEPDSQLGPQPRLVYHRATDGILPGDYFHPVANPRHHWHDWDGAARGSAYVKRLGTLRDLDSKAGSLYKSLHYLARLAANRRHPLIARTGSFDFGADASDQRISTQAYAANGLRGNADTLFADGSPARGNHLYWCEPNDRSREVDDLKDVGLAQLCVTHATDFTDLASVNRWFAAAWNDAAARPGIRAIAVMTHSMFLRGDPDPFRSLDGGSFDVLDRHLAWVRGRYPAVEFATATEALIEFLDYYAPALEAYVEPALCGGDPRQGIYAFPVRLLGRGIRIDERHPATVRIVVPPLFDAADIERARILVDGAPVVDTTAFDADTRPAWTVTLTARPRALRLELWLKPEVRATMAECFATSQVLPYTEPPEARRGPLFRLRAPQPSALHTDVLRLLMHPLAGHAEPLGRRLHPVGAYSIGVVLTAVFAAAAAPASPRKVQLRWRRPLDVDATLTTSVERDSDGGYRVRISDETGTVITESRVWADGPPAVPAA